MSKERRQVYDYYFEGEFLFRIGHVQHLNASPPMEHHTHGSMTEFVYLERGKQIYRTSKKDYLVNQGEFFSHFRMNHMIQEPIRKKFLFYII